MLRECVGDVSIYKYERDGKDVEQDTRPGRLNQMKCKRGRQELSHS